MTDVPVYCSLTPEALRARKEGLLARLARTSTRTVRLETGYRLEFPAESDTLRLIADTIDAERQCCRFLQFVLTVEPDGGPVRLDVTGPAGTHDFLESLLVS